MKSFKLCQENGPLPCYVTESRLPLTNLFEMIYVDFAYPLPTKTTGNRFLLIGVENLTEWPVAILTSPSTAKLILQFIDDKLIQQFGLPRIIVSNKATALMTKAVLTYMTDMRIIWKLVLAYAMMSNGGAERLVDTIQRSTARVISSTNQEWQQALSKALYGY